MKQVLVAFWLFAAIEVAGFAAADVVAVLLHLHGHTEGWVRGCGTGIGALVAMRIPLYRRRTVAHTEPAESASTSCAHSETVLIDDPTGSVVEICTCGAMLSSQRRDPR